MHIPGPTIDRELLKAKLATDSLYVRLAARRYLRIAVTAISLLVCVVLIGLWVRSYFSNDELTIGKSGQSVSFRSVGGVIETDFTPGGWPDTDFIKHESYLIHAMSDERGLPALGIFGVDGYTIVCVPIWLLVAIFATIAALPWIKWHFSLRTLLIVTTLFALFFGTIAMSL